MCVNCDNGNPFDLDDALTAKLLAILTGNDQEPKSNDEQIRELLEDVDSAKAKVVKSVPIDSSVTVHFLPGYSEHGDSVIELVTELQRNYPAPGKVDVYFPTSSDADKVMTTRGMAESQAATSRWGNGKPELKGLDRVITIGKIAFRPKKSTYGWHMPVYDNDLVNEGSYVITHEWGHVVDNRPYSDEYADHLESRMKSGGLVDYSGRPTNRMMLSMSDYAKNSENETFAECFVEWAVTNGKTDNFAAKWYAKEYVWPTLATGIHFTKRRHHNSEAFSNRRYDYDYDYSDFYQDPYDDRY